MVTDSHHQFWSAASPSFQRYTQYIISPSIVMHHGISKEAEYTHVGSANTDSSLNVKRKGTKKVPGKLTLPCCCSRRTRMIQTRLTLLHCSTVRRQVILTLLLWHATRERNPTDNTSTRPSHLHWSLLATRISPKQLILVPPLRCTRVIFLLSPLKNPLKPLTAISIWRGIAPSAVICLQVCFLLLENISIHPPNCCMERRTWRHSTKRRRMWKITIPLQRLFMVINPLLSMWKEMTMTKRTIFSHPNHFWGGVRYCQWFGWRTKEASCKTYINNKYRTPAVQCSNTTQAY